MFLVYFNFISFYNPNWKNHESIWVSRTTIPYIGKVRQDYSLKMANFGNIGEMYK